jgi:hypothetical protein
VTYCEIRAAKLPGLTFGDSTLTSFLTSGLGEGTKEVFSVEVFLIIFFKQDFTFI